MTDPAYKFLGGKRKLVPELMKYVPATFGAYHEPCVGGGAMWLALHDAGRLHHGARLSDTNRHVIDTLLALRDTPEAVIRRLQAHEVEHRKDAERYFYEVRKTNGRVAGASGRDDQEISAAWFLYMNRAAFNGLYRVNKRGEFNAPLGNYKLDHTICDAKKLRAVSKALAGVQVMCQDFRVSAEYVRKGDLVFYDPPYSPLSVTSNFTAYQKEGFGYDEQLALRDTAITLRKRGAHVILSNSAVPMIYSLYAEGAMKNTFYIHEVQAARSINSKGDKRGKITELIIVAA